MTRVRLSLLVLAVIAIPTLVLGGLWLYVRATLHTYDIVSGAMAPALRKGDVILANAYGSASPKSGDIVVFTPPIASGNPFVKRVVGMPGQRLRIAGGRLYRDGLAVAEPYVPEATVYEFAVANYTFEVDGQPLDPAQANLPPKSLWTAPDVLPPGCYVVLGDNRNNSEDSHIWGCAQNGGTLWSGARRGETAMAMQRASRIYAPAERATAL